MNMGVHVSFWIIAWSKYMLTSGIAGSYSNSILSFLRDLHTVFCSCCMDLHSLQHSPLLHTCSSKLFVEFLMMLILTSVRWYFTEALICIPLIISDVEHIFMCLVGICKSLENSVLWSSACFLFGVFVFLSLSCKSCLYILEIKPLCVRSLANIFLPFPRLSLHFFLTASFDVQKLVSLIRSHFKQYCFDSFIF